MAASGLGISPTAGDIHIDLSDSCNCCGSCFPAKPKSSDLIYLDEHLRALRYKPRKDRSGSVVKASNRRVVELINRVASEGDYVAEFERVSAIRVDSIDGDKPMTRAMLMSVVSALEHIKAVRAGSPVTEESKSSR